MTDYPAIVSAAAEVVVAIGAIATAYIAYTQLKDLNDQQKIIGDREKQWQTISICQKYFNDPVLVESKRAIWSARNNGADSKIENPALVKRDAISILNYFDTVAIGVRQGVFIKEIVRDNLGNIMIDAVRNFLEDGYGLFGIPKDHLPDLIAIVNEFRDRHPDHRAVR